MTNWTFADTRCECNMSDIVWKDESADFNRITQEMCRRMAKAIDQMIMGFSIPASMLANTLLTSAGPAKSNLDHFYNKQLGEPWKPDGDYAEETQLTRSNHIQKEYSVGSNTPKYTLYNMQPGHVAKQVPGLTDRVMAKPYEKNLFKGGVVSSSPQPFEDKPCVVNKNGNKWPTLRYEVELTHGQFPATIKPVRHADAPVEAKKPTPSFPNNVVPAKNWHDWLVKTCDQADKSATIWAVDDEQRKTVAETCLRLRRRDIQVKTIGASIKT